MDSFAKTLLSNIQSFSTSKTVETENGSLIESDTGHAGVTAFNKLLRDNTRNHKTGQHLHEQKYRRNRNRYKYKKSYDNDDNDDNVDDDSNSSNVVKRLMETKDNRNLVDELYEKMILEGKKKLSSTKDKELLLDAFVLPFYKRCFLKNIKLPPTTTSIATSTATITETTNDSESTCDEDGDKSLNDNDKFVGEGERVLSYQMLLKLYEYYPKTVLNLLIQYPTFGYWADLFNIWVLCDERSSSQRSFTNYNLLKMHILYIIVCQLKDDINKLKSASASASDSDGANLNISLLAKWMPREGSVKDKSSFINFSSSMDGDSIFSAKSPTYTCYTSIAILYSLMDVSGATSLDYNMEQITSLLNKYYPRKSLNYYRTTLRKKISELNKKLKTFETYATSGNWSKYNVKNLPSKAFSKYTKAFLNESLEPDKPESYGTGNRYPDNEDRVQARKNMISNILSDVKINISGIEPHEILRKFLNDECSTMEKLSIKKQWECKVDEVFNNLITKEGLDINDAEALKKSKICSLIPMMDVSMSMNGLPMDVSIGLGLFICGLQKKCGIKPVAISFTEQPRIFDFSNMTLEEQLNELRTNVGYNTNFEMAINLVLQTIKESRMNKDLIVFTDGQFDQMGNGDNWMTCHQKILSKCVDLKLDTAPNIIYWNLRPDTKGVQASATHPGVQLLQGYSPSIVKFVLYNEELSDLTSQNKDVYVNNKDGNLQKLKVSTKTPYDTYRQALDQKCFDIIRNIVYNSREFDLSLVTES